MKFLIENGADINAVDKKGKTPLHLCCKLLKYPPAVKLLIENHADVSVQDQKQNTPLITLVRWQRPKDLQEQEGALLVELGGSFVEKPLYSADFNAHLEMAEILIHSMKHCDNGLDLCDLNGKSALHWAIFQKHKQIAVLLIQEGADCTKKDHHGDTPFAVCEESLYPADIRQSLLVAIEGFSSFFLYYFFHFLRFFFLIASERTKLMNIKTPEELAEKLSELVLANQTEQVEKMLQEDQKVLYFLFPFFLLSFFAYLFSFS